MGSRWLTGPAGRRSQGVEAGLREVEADVHLLEQHLQAGEAVARGAGHHAARPARGEEGAVGEVRVVAAQVDVEPAGSRDGPGDAVGRARRDVEHPDPAGARLEDLVAHDQRLELRHPAPDRVDRGAHASEPPGRHVLLEPTHPVEHVVHPPAGRLFHDRLQLLALAEGVEDRRDGAELERVRAEEHQVREHPVQLGEQGAQPHGPLGHLHAEHRLDAEDHPELVAERRQPVVPVRQHGDLPVVAHLEELLGAPVHVADDRFGRDDPLTVEHHPQAQHAVGRRVLGADVEHHVGRREPPGTHADVEGAPARLRGHAASLPHAADRPCSAAGEGVAAGRPALVVEPHEQQPVGVRRVGQLRRAHRARLQRLTEGDAVVEGEGDPVAHRDVEGLAVVLVDEAVRPELPRRRPRGPAPRAPRR